MPLQATSGAASYDAFGGGVPVAVNYIEDVFSTYLYTGNSTITNGIDLAGEGGLVWVKGRSGTGSIGDHCWIDTVRGANLSIASNLADGNYSISGGGNTPPTFTATGFTTGDFAALGAGSTAYASWTFREQPKFFDIVTYTGTGSQQSINHNLGSVPGCIIVKRTDTTSSYWGVYHRSLTDGYALGLNTTDAQFNAPSFFVNSASQTSTQFTVGTSANVNASAGTYVAYLFAHDAGGFGLAGTDNVISCGTFTTDGSGNASVTLGYEPQWVMTKITSTTGNWVINDNMRGMPASQTSQVLYPNLTAAESSSIYFSTQPNATGFTTAAYANNPSQTVIYIAIRRGPMKVPTSGTSVFSTVSRTGTSTANTSVTAGFPVDAAFIKASSTIKPWDVEDRLRGGGKYLQFEDTAAEGAGSPASTINFTASNTAVLLGTDSYVNSSANSYANYFLQRAPGFFDEVCYTGTGTDGTVVTHNLTVAPELIIIKGRTNTNYWVVGHSFASTTYGYALLNDTGGGTLNSSYSGGVYFTGQPTTTTMTLASQPRVNGSAVTYVAYLFATCAGVSKCTSFTGTGTLQTIDCGFTSGSRFVLIKRTDSTGDWYVWDSSRGLSSSTDPYLLLNSTAAEVTSTNWVDTTSTGFQVTAASGNNVNINGASYIALAIA